MCNEQRLVPIPEHVWEQNGIHEFDPEHPEYGIDDQGQRCLMLDVCIIPAIRALWDAGVVTLASCCGHVAPGDEHPYGVISIQTLPGVAQRGATMLGRERYEELLAAQADLAAVSIENDEMREALIVETVAEALAELKETHTHTSLKRATDGHPMCDEDEAPWPCSTMVVVAVLDRLRALLARPARTRGAEIVEAARIAAGALMLVRSADSLREKDDIAMAALQAFMQRSGWEPGSLTPEEARRALLGGEGE